VAVVLFPVIFITVEAGLLGRTEASSMEGFEARLTKLEDNEVADDEKDKLAESLDWLVSILKDILFKNTNIANKITSL
jgi:hypothetical protein